MHRKRHGLITDNCIPFLTICVNGDGVMTFKSSPKSSYPIMIVPNEICQDIRGYSIIVPLIFIATKAVPFHQKILKILVNVLKDLEVEGLQWVSEGGNVEKTYVYTVPRCSSQE